MGDGSQQQTTGGGGGNGGSLSSLLYALEQIYIVLAGVFSIGQSVGTTEDLLIGTAATPLYTTTKLVKKAIFQNQSTTDIISLRVQGGSSGKTIGGSAGMKLNPAPATGQAGGSIEMGNIDLSTVTALTNTNNTQTMEVYYEI